MLHDVETGAEYTAFNHLKEDQSDFNIRNSTLSEMAVLGFEYGWSLADPNALVIWEAQFGDFANSAQVIIDQFIASGEVKWSRSSGLVMYLPHGYEGQGPEHSSARLERFLQLSGENNLSVCNFTTPAQLFHALRRQIKRNFRKPMVVMTPKKLLRLPAAVSDLAELSNGSFTPVLDDPSFQDDAKASKVTRVLLCSGKIYYELNEERDNRKLEHIAIVRIEELHPWPAKILAQVLNRYGKAKELVWVQEEPRNMGAWTYVFSQWSGGYACFQDEIGGRGIKYTGRKIGAAPTSGSQRAHVRIQNEIVQLALKT
jgi:2-oxoglutarate dehydrogenase E1 component